MKESAAGARAAGHLPEEIARQLEKRILAGEFPVGAKLPSERELSAEYAVSRPVVREALSQLKLDGLIEARAGSGVYVIDKSGMKAFRVQPVVIEEAKSLEHLLELLVAIEVAATRIAALNRTPEDLKKIRRALIGMEYAIASDRLGDDEDYAFHHAIVAATHNPHFIALCKHLEFGARHVIRRARANTRANLTGLMDAVQGEHKEIFDALEKGDAEEAGAAAERHLRNASERMKVYLRDKAPETP
ncbi:FadR family transcriptional regulator [Rhizobiaceae bacterium BDR2-2]|uniref:FadR family transcriptional regulator n=1 Tax=Ectorhizobium quercum TaxID=2965071 RepID=A0AAE3N231_9HYPH|nr:FadR/GntR family transcriptional regulator [Ectorhizobium quercum]MCX8999373.1 FadR family transcriptional regulator [Ectorhizobium quercum]